MSDQTTSRFIDDVTVLAHAEACAARALGDRLRLLEAVSAMVANAGHLLGTSGLPPAQIDGLLAFYGDRLFEAAATGRAESLANARAI